MIKLVINWCQVGGFTQILLEKAKGTMTNVRDTKNIEHKTQDEDRQSKNHNTEN